MRLRLVIGAVGVGLGGFGIFRLLTQVPFGDLIWLVIWLAGAVVIHDGILSPLILAVGAAIARFVPPGAGRFLQAALVTGALVTVIALPMIYLRGSQPRSKAILRQNFGGNLALLLGIIAAVCLGMYAVRVARERRGPRRSGGLP
ncbi:MAG: hypothetical protein ACR2F6_16215 [Mycobacteriales bacterium]